MQTNLDRLSEEEKQELYDAIPLITILIAGADGNIDEEELEWSKKLTHIRSYSTGEQLQVFYSKIEADLQDKLKRWQDALPKDVKERQASISARLSQLNPILAKMDVEAGAVFYQHLTSFAKHVAKASGGFLGFGSISKEEEELINLPMVTPIVIEEDEA
ncbi:MAG: hypothetical protein AB8G15_12795 [Saprospiraceae bacterium]